MTKRNKPWIHGNHLYRDHVVEVRDVGGWYARVFITDDVVIETVNPYTDQRGAERRRPCCL